MAWFRELIGPDQGADAQQLCMRAILLFIFGIICIRIAGRRTFAQYSPLDIILALIVGSNISRIMTGKADVLPAGAATLVWSCCTVFSPWRRCIGGRSPGWSRHGQCDW
jgi:uncharacterized membrane protein YcaP (DUF421 family)